MRNIKDITRELDKLIDKQSRIFVDKLMTPQSDWKKHIALELEMEETELEIERILAWLR